MYKRQVHICCLIERLVTMREITDYGNKEAFEAEHQEFIEHIHHAFHDVEALSLIHILIINVSLDKLHRYFKDYLSIDEMKTFKTNILKNFSLTNIMNSLTILNPTKLLEQVATAIDELQQMLDTSFSNNTCVGMYVHVCCLIERLVMHQEIDTYPHQDAFIAKHQDFIACVKQTFHAIEAYYRINITSSEIGFLYDYVENDRPGVLTE